MTKGEIVALARQTPCVRLQASYSMNPTYPGALKSHEYSRNGQDVRVERRVDWEHAKASIFVPGSPGHQPVGSFQFRTELPQAHVLDSRPHGYPCSFGTKHIIFGHNSGFRRLECHRRCNHSTIRCNIYLLSLWLRTRTG